MTSAEIVFYRMPDGEKARGKPTAGLGTRVAMLRAVGLGLKPLYLIRVKLKGT